MPALSFPASPTVGQQSVQNGRTFVWTGYAWELVAASGGGEDALLRSLFVPAAPTGLTATAGNASVALSWTAPTGVIAQAPVTDYREQYSADNGATWTTFTAAASTATTATITGLTNGTAVRFRVAAVNAVGVGAYTAASAALTVQVPRLLRPHQAETAVPAGHRLSPALYMPVAVVAALSVPLLAAAARAAEALAGLRVPRAPTAPQTLAAVLAALAAALTSPDTTAALVSSC